MKKKQTVIEPRVIATVTQWYGPILTLERLAQMPTHVLSFHVKYLCQNRVNRNLERGNTLHESIFSF